MGLTHLRHGWAGCFKLALKLRERADKVPRALPPRRGRLRMEPQAPDKPDEEPLSGPHAIQRHARRLLGNVERRAVRLDARKTRKINVRHNKEPALGRPIETHSPSGKDTRAAPCLKREQCGIGGKEHECGEDKIHSYRTERREKAVSSTRSPNFWAASFNKSRTVRDSSLM